MGMAASTRTLRIVKIGDKRRKATYENETDRKAERANEDGQLADDVVEPVRLHVWSQEDHDSSKADDDRECRRERPWLVSDNSGR